MLSASVVVLLLGQAPAYLTDDMNLVVDSGRRLLGSAVDRTCVLPRTHYTNGDKSFTAAGPRVWNSLPPNLAYHKTLDMDNLSEH